MVQESIKCRVVTPIFSRSLEFEDEEKQIYKFELRPQSVKGVLHFWFRALVPRVIDIYRLNTDFLQDMSDKAQKMVHRYLLDRFTSEKYKGLKFLEELIFGSQTYKSPFSLCVYFNEKHSVQVPDESINRDWKSFSYGLYGIYETKNRKGLNSCYLKPNASFFLNFNFSNQRIADVILNVLKVTSLFGGFGSKTTKGFGRFKIEEIGYEMNYEMDKENIYKLFSEFEDSIKKLAASITLNDLLVTSDKELIREFQKVRISNLIIQTPTTEKRLGFPNFLDGNFHVYKIREVRGGFVECFKNLYGLQGSYRMLKRNIRGKNTKNDVVAKILDLLDEVRTKTGWTDGGKSIELRTGILGLPIVYQRLQRKGKKGLIYPNITFYASLPDQESLEERKGRKPSPLRFIPVKKEVEDKYGASYIIYALLMRSNVTDKYLITEVNYGRDESDGEKMIYEKAAMIQEDRDYAQLISELEATYERIL